jgi:hypothetical protein
MFQKSFFIFYPANTLPLPPAIDEPQATGSPILPICKLLTNTVPLPEANEEAWHDEPQQ